MYEVINLLCSPRHWIFRFKIKLFTWWGNLYKKRCSWVPCLEIKTFHEKWKLDIMRWILPCFHRSTQKIWCCEAQQASDCFEESCTGEGFCAAPRNMRSQRKNKTSHFLSRTARICVNICSKQLKEIIQNKLKQTMQLWNLKQLEFAQRRQRSKQT